MLREADTDEVRIVNPPVKLFDGTVTVDGTLATVGSLLESETTAPPSGAGVLITIVPKEASPPTTEDGLMSSVESVAGGGESPAVKLRADDHAPTCPALLIPRTRQKYAAPVASPLVTYMVDPLTDASRTSGAENVLESSIWTS